jgi:hypothetical protein
MPGTAPVRAEAILLIVLVFAGVNVAWLLLFEEAPSARPPAGTDIQPHHDGVRA